MAKKQQSTQQPSRKVGEERNEKLWDTPARPITPTPADTPAQPPTQPPETVQPAQPTQPAPETVQPAQPESKPQSSTEKK